MEENMNRAAAVVAVCAIILLANCSHRSEPTLIANSREPGWRRLLIYGRTSDDQRFSPLTQINEQTVSRLGLLWTRDMNTTRGLEATPLVQNGVIYTTGSWSVVYAMSAKTGELLWTYDPQVPRSRALYICCDVVNRGVALHRGKIYVGTLDGRLIALDAKSGSRFGAPPHFDGSKPTTNFI
jgi:quinohemoprotein ethanol dehydrogenase